MCSLSITLQNNVNIEERPKKINEKSETVIKTEIEHVPLEVSLGSKQSGTKLKICVFPEYVNFTFHKSSQVKIKPYYY